MKFNKKLLVAVLAGTLVLGSGVSTYAIADNTDNAKKLQEKVSVEVLNEILSNVDKIIEKLEKDSELLKLEKNPEFKKLGKISEVEKLKIEVKKERAVFDIPTGLDTEYAIGMLRRFDEAIEKIKQLKAQPEFDTKEKAEEEAKKDLETELVKNAFDLEEKDGKWHYTLKFKEIEPEKSSNSDKKEKTEEKTAEEKKQSEKEKKVDELKNSAEKQKEEEAKKKAEEEKKKAEEEKKSEEMKAEAKKKAEEFKKNAEKKKMTLVRKSEKVNTTTSDNKVSRPVKTTTEKKKLPKAGIEAEALTLATASLAGVLGVYTSIKKRK
jgi:albumin-binding protein family protein-3